MQNRNRKIEETITQGLMWLDLSYVYGRRHGEIFTKKIDRVGLKVLNQIAFRTINLAAQEKENSYFSPKSTHINN